MNTKQGNFQKTKHRDIRIAGKKEFYKGIIKKKFADVDYIWWKEK